MKVRDITEARVRPDQEFMGRFLDRVDDALRDYGEFLDRNSDVDNIDELAEYLNGELADPEFDDMINLEFHVNHKPTQSEWWMRATASAGENEDGELVYDIDIILNAKNLEGTYGPQTFRKIISRLISHEMVHIEQYKRIPDLSKVKTGFQRAHDAKSHQEFMRRYLRDPHELQAYGETLAQEIAATADPQTTIRNPEAHVEHLPTYIQFRKIFPRGDRYIRQLLKYAADYLPDYT